MFLSLITAKSIAQSHRIASKKVTFFNLFLYGRNPRLRLKQLLLYVRLVTVPLPPRRTIDCHPHSRAGRQPHSWRVLPARWG